MYLGVCEYVVHVYVCAHHRTISHDWDNKVFEFEFDMGCGHMGAVVQGHKSDSPIFSLLKR